MGNICRALELAAEIEDLVAAETLDQFCLELLAQGGPVPKFQAQMSNAPPDAGYPECQRRARGADRILTTWSRRSAVAEPRWST